MRTLTTILVFALACLAGAPAHAALKVVATVPALAALAQEVSGGRATVKSLSRASQDPHFVDARPNLAIDLNRADLLLIVGLDLEAGWLPTLITGARNARVQPGGRGHLDCSQLVEPKEVQDRPVDRSMGHIHPAGNPHYLTDPTAALAVARGIAARFAELDPANAATYHAALGGFTKRLEHARAGWTKRLAPLRGSPVFGYHKTLVYLAGWTGLLEVGWLEPKPGIPPNPRHIAHLLRFGKQSKVRAILQEEYYPDKTSQLVAERLGVPLVHFPGGPDFHAGESYLAHVDKVVQLLERALSKGGS